MGHVLQTGRGFSRSGTDGLSQEAGRRREAGRSRGPHRRHYPVTLATAAGKQARLDGLRVEEGPQAPEWLARAWFRGWCSTAA